MNGCMEVRTYELSCQMKIRFEVPRLVTAPEEQTTSPHGVTHEIHHEPHPFSDLTGSSDLRTCNTAAHSYCDLTLASRLASWRAQKCSKRALGRQDDFSEGGPNNAPIPPHFSPWEGGAVSSRSEERTFDWQYLSGRMNSTPTLSLCVLC